MALRERIVEKILENRVTLIVGETGCGTSVLSLTLYLDSVVNVRSIRAFLLGSVWLPIKYWKIGLVWLFRTEDSEMFCVLAFEC